MTSMPDLNITGSPIYEDLVAVSGDPYQPPSYQLPDVYGGGYVEAPPPATPVANPGAAFGLPGLAPTAIAMNAAPEALTQFLGQFLGNGNWFAVLIFGGGAAEQFQRMYQQPQYQQPAYSGYDAASQYSPEQIYQAYQWYAAQQQAQAALEARTPAALPPAPEPYPAAAQYFPPQQQPPMALPEPVPVPMQMQMQQLPPAPQMMQQMQQMPVSYGVEATQQFGGLTQDWAAWLGRASQTANPEMEGGAPGYDDDRRGGGVGGRFGAALRELRGR
jgi:hypothetical protein